jgi:hypothetical protein
MRTNSYERRSVASQAQHAVNDLQRQHAAPSGRTEAEFITHESAISGPTDRPVWRGHLHGVRCWPTHSALPTIGSGTTKSATLRAGVIDCPRRDLLLGLGHDPGRASGAGSLFAPHGTGPAHRHAPGMWISAASRSDLV